MKNILLVITSCLFVLTSFSQADENAPRNNPGRKAGGARFYGRVVDTKTNKGIDAASVQLFKLNNDSLVGGMLTRPNGDFNIDNLNPRDSFKLMVSAIGFATREIPIGFGKAADGEMLSEKDLGNIKLEQDAQFLGAVTVVGQKPALQMGIDRKTFDVSKSLVSTGGTAIDVMRNIPSVTVDVDGNVSLRNSPPQIFVDGRPTILTLDQIPADHIERVELITNPSAKFDAASVGGIINVVLKKDKRLGLNGLVSASIGSPKVLNGNLAVNLRQGKFNFFVDGNYNQGGGLARSESYRENKDKGVTENFFTQYSRTERMRRFNSIRFGMDYFLDNRNTISISQNFVQGRFTNNESQDQWYYDAAKVLDHSGERFSNGKNRFNRSNTRLNFKHNFVDPGHELTADINYNTGGGKNNSFIVNNYFNTDGSQYSPSNQVRNDGRNDNSQVTIQVDYTDPTGEDSKLEAGARTYINDFTSIFNSFSVSNGGETKLPLSNNYKYREMVNAVYFTYSGKTLGIGYQAGLRAEHSRFTGELIDSARKFGYEYPKTIDNLFDALFPSLFLTKEIGDDIQLQLNYSRRIRRPNFWQLNPFVDINDPFNIQQGNPQLKPEFTNSFEFNFQKTYNSGSFLGVVYFRNTEDDITRYSDTITDAQYQQLNNAAVDPNAILNTFINANRQNRLGVELTLQQKLGDQFDITPTVNMQYRKVVAGVNSVDLSNEGYNWDAKLILNYRIASKAKFWNKFSFQVMGEYESPEVIPQGKNKEQYAVDFGLRKEFLKNNKATLSFNIQDVFNTRRFGTIYDTDEFYQDSYRRWNVRTFRVSLSYRFGSSEFHLFKRNNNNRRERDDNDDHNDSGGNNNSGGTK